REVKKRSSLGQAHAGQAQIGLRLLRRVGWWRMESGLFKTIAGFMLEGAAVALAAFAPAQVLAAEPIKIGAVLPFSGGVELYGERARLGLELAAADINAAGGILGRPVVLVFRDDGTRPQIAAEAARKVVEEDGVLAVVGPITSQNLDAIVPVLASHRTPLLYATNYEGGQCSRYMFALN